MQSAACCGSKQTRRRLLLGLMRTEPVPEWLCVAAICAAEGERAT
jgi:hypothetical protein